MNINNPSFNAPVTFNENHYTSELEQIRQIADSQAVKDQDLTAALNRLADAVEAGNAAAAQKNASSIIKSVGSETLTNVLSSSILAMIRRFAGV